MKNYYRATITVPRDIYQKTRVQAAHENKSVSRFVSDVLGKQVGRGERKSRPLPFGKYRLNGKKPLDRASIYEPYLRGKVSS